MAEPVRTTVLVLLAIGFVLCLIGIFTPFWGVGVMTKLDDNKGVVENLMNTWDESEYVKASIWNSNEWWPEASATGTGVKGSGALPEAKAPAILSLIVGVVAIVLHAIYTFKAECNYSKVWAVLSGCSQITSAVLSSISCCVMAGCLTNKMAASPLFRLGDSFILTVIGSILFGVCGMFTLFHFVYSVKELALDKKILLMYPEVVPQEPQYGAGIPEGFPTSTSIAGHLASPSEEEELCPLFWQPGKRGFYSPRARRPSVVNMAYRNVGRVMGLCLLQNDLCPLTLCRHVLKYLLGRPLHFHDMAFYNPTTYESLRQTLLYAETDPDALASLDLTFTVDLCVEEGGGTHLLIPNGHQVAVTVDNVYDYVAKCCEFKLVKCVQEPLDQLRSGLFDVLPKTALDGLTSEDLRLLLCGVGEIDLVALQKYTGFNDESGEPADRLARFKKWFWSVAAKFTQQQRQDLLYFWTSSPALPASAEGFQPMPSVTVRPAEDNHLPTANTCISRLYIPLYTSKAVLRSKLLMAIQTKSFGFV